MTTETLDQIMHTTSAFRLLSDPTRCKMILLLSKRQNGMCVYELADETNVSHSAASHQLARLEMKGIVTAYPEGKKVCYRLKDTPFTKNILHVMKIFNL